MEMDIRMLPCWFILFTTVTTGEAAFAKVCIGQFLDIFDFEICPFGQSVQITSAYVGESSLPPTAQDQCPSDPGDCRADIMTEMPDYLDFLRRQCERKILCDIFVAETDPIMCGPSPANPDYLYFEYECVSVSDQLTYDVSCVGETIDGLQCPEDFGIKIVQALFADTGTGGCEAHDATDYQCVANITQLQPLFFESIQASCEGLATCTGTVTAEAYTIRDCGNITDVTTNNVALGYECVPVVKNFRACPLQSFDGLTCAPGYVIDVLSAYYVNQLGDFTLAECENLAAVNVCLTYIPTNNPSYYAEIVDKCQDKQACEGLMANRGNIGLCFRNERPDYVRIYYQCMLGELPSTTEGSTEPTTSAASTSEAAEPPSTTGATTAGSQSTTAEDSSTTGATTAGSQSTTAEASSTTGATTAGSQSTTAEASSTTGATTVAAAVTTTARVETTATIDTRLPLQSTTAAPQDTTLEPSTSVATDSTEAPEKSTTAADTTDAPATTDDGSPTAAPSPLSQTDLYIIVGVAVGLVPLVGIILAIAYCCKKSPAAAPKTTPPAVQQYDPYFLQKNVSTVPSNFRW